MWNFLSWTHRNSVEKWLPGAGGGRNRKRLVKGYKLLLVRGTTSEDLMHDMVTIVDNTVLYNWNLLTVELQYSHKQTQRLSTLSIMYFDCMVKRFCFSNMIKWNAMKIVLKIASPMIVTVILILVFTRFSHFQIKI